MCVAVSHGAAWRCRHLFCGNQKGSPGRPDCFKESHPGPVYAERLQTGAAVALLEGPRRFSMVCYRVACRAGPRRCDFGWGRAAHCVKPTSILGSSSCSLSCRPAAAPVRSCLENFRSPVGPSPKGFSAGFANLGTES